MIKKIKKKMIDDNFFKGCHSLVEKMVGVGHVFHKRMRNLLLLLLTLCGEDGPRRLHIAPPVFGICVCRTSTTHKSVKPSTMEMIV